MLQGGKPSALSTLAFINAPWHDQSMDPSQVSQEARRVLQMEGEALLHCSERLQKEPFQGQFFQALEVLRQASENKGKVIVTGLGKSGKIGQKIAATLCSTGCLAVFLHPTEGLHGDLGLVDQHDVVLALSHSGSTQEVLDLLPSLRHQGVKVIGLGGNDQSRLALSCDIWIDARIEQEACPHNLAPTTSSTLALALGDALAVTLMKIRNIDVSSFARNHPGGTLGKRLHWKVSDLMHSGSAVGTVQAQDGIETIVDRMTEKHLGGILVVQGQTLMGIITEGDIRRAVRQKEKFFVLKAQDLMSSNPITVQAHCPIQEALDLMEKRSRPIHVLAVVDAQQQWQGLIRLHDIVQHL